MEGSSPRPVDTGNGHSAAESSPPSGHGEALRVAEDPPVRHNRFHPDRNPGGWNELVTKYRDFMVQAALRFTDDPHIAEDIVQDALKTLCAIHWNFSPLIPDALRKWLRRQVRLAASRVIRPWRSNMKLVDHRRLHRRMGDRPPRRHEITFEDYARMYETTKRAVSKRFRDNGWRAFESVYEMGIDTRETAEAMGISANAVYIYGCRILASMREEGERILAREG